jgi:hypothetical protein
VSSTHLYSPSLRTHGHSLIIADGQVTDGDLQDTINSIVEASNFALSIIVVGVGVGLSSTPPAPPPSLLTVSHRTAHGS